MRERGFSPLVRGLLLSLGLYLALRWAVPLMLPFLAGLLLAMGAEPAVRLLERTAKLGRGPAGFLGVSFCLAALTGLGLLLFSVGVRLLGQLGNVLPDLEDTARQGLTALQDRLLSLAYSAPESLRPLLTKAVLGLFTGGSSLYGQMASQLPGLATGLVARITGGFLGLGTAILSAYLISPRLPRLKVWAAGKLPEIWRCRVRSTAARVRVALSGWLRAQAGLMGLTFLLVWLGLTVLGIRHAPVWAAGVALIDAVPMLGTGLVLVPWSLVSFLRGDPVLGVGLGVLFAAATLVRSALEPRLVGQQLGLDPLVTLGALYLGYQLLGFPGLLLAPLLAVTVTQAVRSRPQQP